ncbi:hypothetical protein ACHWQZ_G011253 [Mnemiopsis leidyi]
MSSSDSDTDLSSRLSQATFDSPTTSIESLDTLAGSSGIGSAYLVPVDPASPQDTQSKQHPLATKPKVLVTGVTGFVASHITKRLLKTNKYIVHGTVRSRHNRKRVKPVTKFHNAVENLRLFECNLLDDLNWDRAVSDCTYVIHVASPFPDSQPGEPSSVVIPAVEGTKRVLDACKRAGTVKRVVLTSSIAAISGGKQRGDYHYTEGEWSSQADCDPYCLSKVLAEKAAWETAASANFELVALNPTMCLGPVLVGECTSMLLVKRILEGGYPMLPKIFLPTVDVRDVADAHISAMLAPNAAGKRIIIHSTNFWLRDIAQTIHDVFSDQGYKISIRDMPDWALTIASKINKSAKFVSSSVGKIITYDTKNMHEILGIQGRDVRAAVIDMCYSMIELKLASKKDKYVSNVCYLDDTELSFENVVQF